MKCKKGFALIETLIYIFVSTIIIIECVSFTLSSYKLYLKNRKLTIKYNNIQNFYLSLDEIKNKEENIDIYADIEKNKVTFVKAEKVRKEIYMNSDKKIVVTSYNDNCYGGTNTMYGKVKSFDVIKKENLIDLKICDEFGEVFVLCL